jgi:hypothetical protein
MVPKAYWAINLPTLKRNTILPKRQKVLAGKERRMAKRRTPTVPMILQKQMLLIRAKIFSFWVLFFT